MIPQKMNKEEEDPLVTLESASDQLHYFEH